MKRKIIVLCILLILLATESVFAMSSPAYRIEWTNLLSGSGGSASSASYQVNVTVGQTVNDKSGSPLYAVQMGYWAGMIPFEIFMPRVVRSP